jgi:hypothetical protein
MNTAKHTPGPWTVSAGRTIETPSGQFYLTYNMDKHGNPLFRSFVELDSNAALVAAAPTMYADLCAVRDYLFELYDEGNAKAGEYAASLGITIEQAEGQHHE